MAAGKVERREMNTLRVERIEWNNCESIIKQLYSGNIYLTPYQSWEYLNSTGKGFTARHPLNMLGIKEKCFVLYEDDNPVAVAPLLVKKENGRNTIFLRGHFTGAGNLDFVYSCYFTYEHFAFFVQSITDSLDNSKWIIDRISEKSLTFEYWKRYTSGLAAIESSEICVEIKTNTSHDEWMKSLSKSVRQNVRTSYNRLNTDGKAIRVNIVYDSRIPERLFNEMVTVASKRAVEYDKHKQRWLWRIYYPLKKFDPLLKFLRKYKHCFYATVHIDGQLAASLMGFRANDGRYIIPRLSYNSDFYRYSPGGILVNETMKSLCAKEKDVNLDLSRGDEKYKYDFGGKEHLIYSFSFAPIGKNHNECIIP